MSKLQEKYADNTEPFTVEDVTFHCVLPTKENKRFQREVAIARVVVGDDGKLEGVDEDMTTGGFIILQMECFARTCIRGVDGWAGEFTPGQLIDMPDALEDLWEQVTRRVYTVDTEASDNVKKLAATLSGPPDGLASRNSTSEPQSAAS